MQNSYELDANCTKEFLTKFSDDNVWNCFYLITSVRLLLPVKCTHRKHDENWWWCLKISMLMHCWQIKWQSESIVVTVNKQFCKMLLNGNSDVQCRCSIFFSGCQWCVYMHCIALQTRWMFCTFVVFSFIVAWNILRTKRHAFCALLLCH